MNRYLRALVVVPVGALKMGVAGAALATVAVQGILSTFLVRIPVSYAMSKVSGSDLRHRLLLCLESFCVLPV